MITDEKLLIMHLDDIGMGHAANQAAIRLFEKWGNVSASVMMPCHWAYDFIQRVKKYPQFDVGIHATLTCEWDYCRWRPLLDRKTVPGLVDRNGFMWKSNQELLGAMTNDEFEKEINRQIRQALEWELSPTHLDNHMWTAGGNEQLFKTYVEISQIYGLVPHIPEKELKDNKIKEMVNKSNLPVVNKRVKLKRGIDYRTIKERIYRQLDEVKAGLNVITIHPVIDTPEIRVVIPSWEERYEEYQVFMEDETYQKIEESGIKLVTWKNIKEMIFS